MAIDLHELRGLSDMAQNAPMSFHGRCAGVPWFTRQMIPGRKKTWKTLVWWKTCWTEFGVCVMVGDFSLPSLEELTSGSVCNIKRRLQLQLAKLKLWEAELCLRRGLCDLWSIIWNIANLQYLVASQEFDRPHPIFKALCHRKIGGLGGGSHSKFSCTTVRLDLGYWWLLSVLRVRLVEVYIMATIAA